MRIRKGLGIGSFLIWIWATSCAASNSLIPDGVYREPTKVEAVSVQGEKIEFQIRISGGEGERVVKRKYKYSLSSGNHVHVIASSNDSVFVFGVLKYGWFWDGKAIVRKQPNSGDTTIFAREP